jgi:V/A-type H+-transporting ATPase subunit F
MRFYVIGDESAVTGFGLAGVEGEVVETVDEAREALEKAFASGDVGIIIVTETIASQLRAEVDAYVFGRTFPLIIEIPDRTGAIEGRVSIRQLVRSAVGVNV